MEVEFTGRQTEVPAAARAAVTRRLDKLQKVLHGITHVHVVLAADKHRRIAEVTVHSPHLKLTAEEESDELALAAASVMDRLVRQAQRHLGRHRGRKRSSARRGAAAVWSGILSARDVAAAPGSTRVVQTRRVLARPMSVDEAILELEADGEDLLVFRDSGTDQLHILYKRKDGRLGVIEPEG
jgi:putative sigma-54 modulation protein